MPHGNRVAHGDRSELDGRPAGGFDSLLDVPCQVVQMDVAGRHFVPGTGNGDEGAVDRVVVHAHGTKHRAMRRPFRTFGHFPTAVLQLRVYAHRSSPELFVERRGVKKRPAGVCAPKVRASSREAWSYKASVRPPALLV